MLNGTEKRQTLGYHRGEGLLRRRKLGFARVSSAVDLRLNRFISLWSNGLRRGLPGKRPERLAIGMHGALTAARRRFDRWHLGKTLHFALAQCRKLEEFANSVIEKEEWHAVNMLLSTLWIPYSVFRTYTDRYWTRPVSYPREGIL